MKTPQFRLWFWTLAVVLTVPAAGYCWGVGSTPTAIVLTGAAFVSLMLVFESRKRVRQVQNR